MSCPHCRSKTVRRRRQRTSLGYRRFWCATCRRRFNERTGTPFNELQCPTDVVLLAVLWRLRYKLSFRDVAELLLLRGYMVTRETVRVWELRFAPLVTQQLRARHRGRVSVSWYLDETYVKVAGVGATSTAQSTATGLSSTRCSASTAISTPLVVSSGA